MSEIKMPKNDKKSLEAAYRRSNISRTAATVMLVAVGLFGFGKFVESAAGNSNPPVAANGGNTFPLGAPGLHETLIASRNSPENGQMIDVTWGSDELSNFARNLIIATPSAGKSTAQKVLAGEDQGMMVTGTMNSYGGITDGKSVEMKVPLDTDLTMLAQEEKPTGTTIKLVK